MFPNFWFAHSANNCAFFKINIFFLLTMNVKALFCNMKGHNFAYPPVVLFKGLSYFCSASYDWVELLSSVWCQWKQNKKLNMEKEGKGRVKTSDRL
jgi:hypothetical protein